MDATKQNAEPPVEEPVHEDREAGPREEYFTSADAGRDSALKPRYDLIWSEWFKSGM